MMRWAWWVMVFALASVVTLVALHWMGVWQPTHAYLAAYCFGFSSVLGALLLVMSAHVTAASWFVVMRRLAEAIASSAPMLVVLFVPIALATPLLYPWAGPLEQLDESVRDTIERTQQWMNTSLFVLRAAVLLALWVGYGEMMRRASLRQDQVPVVNSQQHQIEERRLVKLSAGGLPLFVVTGSMAAFDWLMSAVPGWNFNILGFYLLAGGFGSAVGMTCIGLHFARSAGYLPDKLGPDHVHALGRVLLMSVCVWSYLAVSQLVIAWSANLPHEAGFYIARFQGVFEPLAWVLVFGHLVVPFLLLLSRPIKRSSRALAVIGAWLTLMHALDTYWLLMPVSEHGPSLWDPLAFVLVSAALGGLAAVRFSRAASTPSRAPNFERSLAYESP